MSKSPGKVSLYNLGSLGVDVSVGQLHKPDGSLLSAQNATPDLRAQAGAITKRDGLIAVNEATAGAIQGAVFVAVTNLSNVGSEAGGNVERRLYLGAREELGWVHSSDSFATEGTLVTVNPLPVEDTETAVIDKSVTVANKIYYSAGGHTDFTQPPTIRVFDGIVDREFVRLLPNLDIPSRAFPQRVSFMYARGTTIYISVHDDGTTSADLLGTVFSLSVLTGVLTRLGGTFPTGKIPTALTWHLGRLWATTYTAGASVTTKAYFVRPGIDTVWTEDEEFTAMSTVSAGDSIVDFRGTLYLAISGSAGGATGVIMARSPANGAWSTSESAASTSYTNLTVFKDNLYVIKYTAGTSLVRKFDGSTWATMTTPTLSGLVVLMFQDNGSLYAVTPGAEVTVSTDGTTWSALRTVYEA